MAASTTVPVPSVSREEVTVQLRKAAYFSLYSMPNPQSANVIVPSLEPLGIKQVQVHEQLHRFPIDLSAGTIVGEPIGTVAMKWTPMPPEFIPVPNVEPPATVLEFAGSQPFLTMDGALTFGDGTTKMYGFGHGHTYSQVAGDPTLFLGAVVNMLQGEGQLFGGQGTVLVNGHIKPPKELSLSVVARYLDPDGKFAGDKFSPVQVFPNPDPTYATLMLMSEVDPSAPLDVERDGAGNITGWKVNEILRLVSTDWDASGPNGMRSEVTAETIVGRFTAQMNVSFQSQSATYPVYVASTSGGLITFQDCNGHPIGTIQVDIEVGNAFDINMPTFAVRTFRLGGFGPIVKASGIFDGAQGVMSVNGAFATDPLAVSSLHIFRLYDPTGVIRSLMKDAWDQGTRNFPATTLSKDDEVLVAAADDSLARGTALKSWFDQKDAHNSFTERFELIRSYDPDDRTFGYFDTAQINEGAFNVMGVFEEMPFDCPKTVAGDGPNQQIREFVMRYFLRSTSYTVPVPAGRAFNEPPGLIAGLFFGKTNTALRGFGYTQQYYKTLGGNIGKFALEDQHAVVDLRMLGTKFEWIILQVQIFDFVVPFKPLGENLPQISIPLQEQTYVVISKNFVVDRPEADEYGLGYAILKGSTDSPDSLFAYGPGRFQLGFQTIHFKTDKSTGATKVTMAFGVDRPSKVLNIPYDPFGYAFRLLSLIPSSLASTLSTYMSAYLPSFLTPTGIDPVQLYIAALNLATAGAAAEHFGVSKGELDRMMLTQHSTQDYQMIQGAMSAFQRVHDWLDSSTIPIPIRSGVPKLD